MSPPPPEDPPPSRLAPRAVLARQLEPLHEASVGVSLLSLLPAVQVAWADGAIQDKERRAILDLARREGLVDDEASMQQLTHWLEEPPSNDAVRDMIGELRGTVKTTGGADEKLFEKAVAWARAVARAEGGLLGVGAVDGDEARTLDWLETALDPAHGSHEMSGPPSRRTRPAGGLSSSSITLMRDLMLERMAAEDDYVDLVPKDADSPLPQPCTLQGAPMAPAVFGVPQEDYDAYMKQIVSRYVKTLAFGTRRAMEVATRDAMSQIDDAELGRLVLETPFSRMLVSDLDPRDEQLFGERIAQARSRGTPYKLDLSHIAHAEALPGLSIAPTVSLFALGEGRLEPVAIAVGDRTFAPGDGASWDLAIAFALQGLSISIVTAVHPTLHFPMDSVIAISRAVLPLRHPMRRLVEGHAYLHLPLDYGVRFSPRSVAWNSQKEIYTPFPMGGQGIFRGNSDIYAGIEGNSGYPAWRYPMAAPDFPGPYGAFLRAYYDVILAFCEKVAARVAADEALTTWATTLGELLPGFPSPEALRDPSTLARVLAGFVHSVSVWHSAEHHVYAEIPVRKVPQRLRVQPPTGGDRPPPRHEWVRHADVFRQELARQMFYEAHTIRPLLEVDYGFDEPELRNAAEAFFEGLRACDRAQPRRYMELERIACSIQF